MAIENKRIIVVAHGAWSGGWSWYKMEDLFCTSKFRLKTFSYTGIGDRGHLLSESINLSMHINDLIQVIRHCGQPVTLLAHSYGGVVAAGVIDKLPDMIDNVIFIDAMFPGARDSVFSLMSKESRDKILINVEKNGRGWLIPPTDLPEDTPVEDLLLAKHLRGSQPLGTFSEEIDFNINKIREINSIYIYCTKNVGQKDFEKSRQNVKEICKNEMIMKEWTHNPHITNPDELFSLILNFVDYSDRSRSGCS